MEPYLQERDEDLVSLSGDTPGKISETRRCAQVGLETAGELRRIEERFVEAMAQSILNLDRLQVATKLEPIGSSELIRSVELRSDLASLSYYATADHGAPVSTETVSFPLSHENESEVLPRDSGAGGLGCKQRIPEAATAEAHRRGGFNRHLERGDARQQPR